MNSETGKWIIFTGIVMVAIGLIIYFFHDRMGWMGNLPGDIRIERENFRMYFPITTMILLSILLSLVIYIINKFF